MADGGSLSEQKGEDEIISVNQQVQTYFRALGFNVQLSYV